MKMVMNPLPTPAEFRERADDYLRAVDRLVRAARNDGVVITVATMPCRPLAMGRYETRIDARPARELYGPWMENGDA